MRKMKAELPKSSSVGHRKASANAHTAPACSGVKYSLMKPAAIGVRVHSGWGAVVAVAGQNGVEEIIERRKVAIIDAKKPGVAQPYHYVEEMELSAAERHLTQCAIDSKRLAREAVSYIYASPSYQELHAVFVAIVACGLLRVLLVQRAGTDDIGARCSEQRTIRRASMGRLLSSLFCWLRSLFHNTFALGSECPCSDG